MGCFIKKSVGIRHVKISSGDLILKNKDYKSALRSYNEEYENLIKNEQEISIELVKNIAECLEFVGNSKETLNFFNNLKTDLISHLNTKANTRSTELLQFTNDKLVNHYIKQSQYKEALATLEDYKNTNKPSTKNSVKIENRIALCHKYLGDFQKALKILNDQILYLLSDTNQNAEDLSIIHGNIACCYLKLGKFELCSDHLKKSLEFKQKSSIKSLTQTYNNFAVYYYKLNDFDKAAEYLQKASNAYVKETKNESLLAKIVNNQIACWIKLEKTDKAEQLVTEYQKIYNEYLNRMSVIHLASHFNNMLVYLFKVGRIDELHKCFEEFSKLFKEVSEESFQYIQYFVTKSMYLYYNNQIPQARDAMSKGFNLSTRYIGSEYFEYKIENVGECDDEEMNIEDCLAEELNNI